MSQSQSLKFKLAALSEIVIFEKTADLGNLVYIVFVLMNIQYGVISEFVLVANICQCMTY